MNRKTELTERRERWILAKRREYMIRGVHVVTVRQLYYLATVDNRAWGLLLPKTEAGYKAICWLLKRMRETRLLPPDWIRDNTRYVIRPETYKDARSAVFELAANYRKNLWDSQKEIIEIWIEKQALTSVFDQVTKPFAVPLFATKGYCSISALYSAFTERRSVKPRYIYYFGDHDPTGINISDTIGKEAQAHNVIFERVSVTREQIIKHNLPGRPSKKKDTRTVGFELQNPGSQSVELDALPPDVLQAMIKKCIENHIDKAAWQAAEKQQANELAELEKWAVGIDHPEGNPDGFPF